MTHTESKSYAGLPSWRRQSSILADRYLDVMLGDVSTLLLLVAQAPLIAALCVVVWSNVEKDTDTLYFVLVLTSVWFGCINACREIVKERPLLERERLFGLSPLAYVLAKARVLFGLDLVQVALLLGIVEWRIGLRGSLLWQAVALLLCAFAGTGLGLVVSALSRRQERAVAAVPLLILPQILFSEFTIPREHFGSLTAWIERLTIVKWGYHVFEQTATVEPDYALLVGSLLALCAQTAVLLAATLFALRFSRRDVYL